MENIIETLNRARLDGRRTSAAVIAVEHIATGKRLVIGYRNLSKRLYDQRMYLARYELHNSSLQVDLLRDGPNAFRIILLALVNDLRHHTLTNAYHVSESRRRGLSYHG